jgi:hypothetical protein
MQVNLLLAALLAFPTPVRVGGKFGQRPFEVVGQEWSDPTLLFLTNFAGGTTTPRVAKGSGTATFARSTAATLRTCSGGVTTLSTASSGVARFETDCNGRRGYLPERAISNVAIQSADFGTSWTEADAGDTQSLNAIAAPDGNTAADGNIADATDGDHGFSQAITLTATTYVFSVFTKAGNKSWIYLSDDTVANATGYANTTTCATGTKGAGAAALYAESYGNGWCRTSIVFTGTVAAHTIKVLSADADNDKTVTGDSATINTYFWGAQVEAIATAVASSYRPTTTTSVSRGADIMTYTSTGNVSESQGSVVCRVVVPNSTATAGVFINLYSAVNNRWQLFESALDVVQFFGTASGSTQATINSTSGISDGTVHTIAGSWATNDARLYIDGVQHSSTDTSVTPPTGLTSITIGHVLDDFQPGSLILDCAVYSTPYRTTL